MGEREEPCPTPMLMLKEGEEKLFQRFFLFYLLDNLGRILRFWS